MTTRPIPNRRLRSVACCSVSGMEPSAGTIPCPGSSIHEEVARGAFDAAPKAPPQCGGDAPAGRPGFARRCRLPALAPLVFAAALAAAGPAAAAGDWPARPVNVIVGTAAGSAPDIIARLIGDQLARRWEQPVVVHNRPGAGGNLGAQAAARAAPDGYTLWVAHATPVVMNEFLFSNPGFDAARDFAPVVRIGVNPMMVSVNLDTPYRTIDELLAKRAPGERQLSFAVSGSKNIPHLVGASLNSLSEAEMVHVPYKGSQQAAADTIAGRTEVYIDALPSMAPLLQQPARVRPLAVTSAQRLPGFETVPTLRESGVDLVMQGWISIMAPAGTPERVIERVAADVNEILGEPAVAERLAALGTFELGGTTADFAAFIDAERQQWGQAVKAAGIEPE